MQKSSFPVDTSLHRVVLGQSGLWNGGEQFRHPDVGPKQLRAEALEADCLGSLLGLLQCNSLTFSELHNDSNP